MKKILSLSLLLLFCIPPVFAQETEIETEIGYESEFTHHQLGIMIGHSHISQGHRDGGKKWLALPMVSLNYNYRFNQRWALGLHTDIILEDFEVEQWNGSKEDKIIKRDTPIAPALMLVYKPGKHFSYMIGFGEEFAKEEDLFLLRLETEYSVELPKEFEFGAGVGYDIRFDAYDSWALIVGVSKLF